MVDLNINEREKSNNGLQDDGIVGFRCSNCDKALLELQLTSVQGVKAQQVLTRVAVYCRDCDSFSDTKVIDGRFHPGAASDDMCFDVFDGIAASQPEADIIFMAWEKKA